MYLIAGQDDHSTTGMFDGTTAMSMPIENFILGGWKNDYGIDRLCLEIGQTPDTTAVGTKKAIIARTHNRLLEFLLD